MAKFSIEHKWATLAPTTRHWIGDFNGDGNADVLSYRGGGHWGVSLCKGDSIDAMLGIGFASEIEWSDPAIPLFADINLDNGDAGFVGDFNGDGVDDLMAYYSASGNWRVAKSIQSRLDGSWHFVESTYNWASGQASRFPLGNLLIGDFNGDGRCDRASAMFDGHLYVAFSNGSSFNDEVPMNNSNFSNWICDERYVGDFNGDGKADIALYSNGGWWRISLSNISSSNIPFFSTPTLPVQLGNGSSLGYWIGDFDGDGKSDILNNQSAGQWYVSLSTGNNFGSPSFWASGQGEYSQRPNLFVGDFNGDGLCDRMTYTTGGEFWVATSVSPDARITAVWLTNNYDNSDVTLTANFWNSSKRDGAKTPKIGYGTDTLTCLYNSADHDVIKKQISAMRAVGINLVIIDFTNRFFDDIDPNTGEEDLSRKHLREATTAWFEVVDELKLTDFHLAIGLGYEFWGPRPGTGNWTAKLDEQSKAFNRLQSEYIERYPSVYYKYLNRPLVLIYLQSGTQLPLVDYGGYEHPIWNDPRFTLRNFVTWTQSWAYMPDINIDYWYHNGSDNIFHGWGWGSLYGGMASITGIRPSGYPANNIGGPGLPKDAECMAIMPGTNNYWDPAQNYHVDRNSGIYYIASWTEVLRNMPRIALITDWNNWNEETAIESCTGVNGWKDYSGRPAPDWYLRITEAYSHILKYSTIKSGTYFKTESSNTVYYMDGAISRPFLDWEEYIVHSSTAKNPVIVLPDNWTVIGSFSKNGNNEKATINPIVFNLAQNYPNPFNPSTAIRYSIPQDNLVTIKVYDVIGREVATVVNEVKPAGYYETSFDASKLSSGLYIYKIQAGEFSAVKKMQLIK